MPPITARRAAEAGDRWRSGVLSLPGAMTFPVDMPWSIACLQPGNGSAVRLLHYTYRLRFREDRNNPMPAHRPGGRVERHSSWLLWRVHSLEQPSRTAVLCLTMADVEGGWYAWDHGRHGLGRHRRDRSADLLDQGGGHGG